MLLLLGLVSKKTGCKNANIQDFSIGQKKISGFGVFSLVCLFKTRMSPH
jgi:hypothetical protein